MGQAEWGHTKLVTDPLPPSSNRDKIHFSRGELIREEKPQINMVQLDMSIDTKINQ